MKKSSFNSQFKKGTYPDQHWDESTRVNGHEQDPPSVVRKRQGVARGSQTEKSPISEIDLIKYSTPTNRGMTGKGDYARKRRK